jgi:hypothetical protein
VHGVRKRDLGKSLLQYQRGECGGFYEYGDGDVYEWDGAGKRDELHGGAAVYTECDGGRERRGDVDGEQQWGEQRGNDEFNGDERDGDDGIVVRDAVREYELSADGECECSGDVFQRAGKQHGLESGWIHDHVLHVIDIESGGRSVYDRESDEWIDGA